MTEPTAVNNAVYGELGQGWYEAEDDPIALLRAENRLRNPWIAGIIREIFPNGSCRALDVGCGAGFLAGDLSKHGHEVVGLDASEESLLIARQQDVACKVTWLHGDARHLPFEDSRFDVVCAMDFLEHVEDPSRVIAEASRVLKPGGLFFFHTFNRNPMAWLLVIKCVEWLLKKTPKNLHVLRLFIKPRELTSMCGSHGLEIRQIRGLRPVVFSAGFFRFLFRGVVKRDFQFAFTKSKLIAYSGFALKNASHPVENQRPLKFKSPFFFI